MHKRNFPSSHSSIVAAVEDGGSYSSSRRLWSAIFGKIFECTEHSADLNSSSAVPGSMGLTSCASRWRVAGAYNLQQVDNMCMMRSAVGGHPSLRTTVLIVCRNALWRIIASQIQKLEVSSFRFPAPCCTKLSQSTRSENCAPDGCQSNWHQNTKQSTWSQHWHFCSGTMMMPKSFLTGWIITGDETWVACISQETKQQLMLWHHSGSPCKMKFNRLCVSWNVFGLVGHVLMGYHFPTFHRKLRLAFSRVSDNWAQFSVSVK